MGGRGLRTPTSYALGAVITAQLNEALRAERPSLDAEIAAGEFGGLIEWLRDNVHGDGARVPVKELIKKPPASRSRPRRSCAISKQNISKRRDPVEPDAAWLVEQLKSCRRSCAAPSARPSAITA